MTLNNLMNLTNPERIVLMVKVIRQILTTNILKFLKTIHVLHLNHFKTQVLHDQPLLWIMNFRKRFNIPETATESLIKFVKLVLIEFGSEDFNAFPDSLYLARNELGLKDKFHVFVPCPKCHKLYEKHEVENFRKDETPAIMKCRHVEFPNSSLCRSRLCQAPLSRQTKLLNGAVTNRPELIYPFAGIKDQLTAMFSRPNFESSLRHWAHRSNFDNILTDIYDGNVWKTFKDDDSTNFFQDEVADSHLGLMLNLDWFQPYDGTV